MKFSLRPFVLLDVGFHFTHFHRIKVEFCCQLLLPLPCLTFYPPLVSRTTTLNINNEKKKVFTSSVLDINFVLSVIELYTLGYFCAADIKLPLVVCVQYSLSCLLANGQILKS